MDLDCFVAGLISVWLMQKVSRKKQVGTRLVMVAGQTLVAGACTLLLVSIMLVLCDIYKTYLARLMVSAGIACLSLRQD